MPSLDTEHTSNAHIAHPNGDHRAPDLTPKPRDFPDTSVDWLEVQVRVWTRCGVEPRSASPTAIVYQGEISRTLH